jgi:serine/threonine protein kinase
MWSLGITLYQLMGRRLPYIGGDDHEVNMAIWTKPREKLSNNYSQSLRDLVNLLLNTDPETRPNIERVLRYPLVRAELDNILKDLIPLTYNYPTAMTAHLLLEQVIEIQCKLAK